MAPPETVAMIGYLSVSVLPIVALFAIFIIRSAQPETHDIVSGDLRLGVVGALAARDATTVTGQLWLALAVGGAVGCSLYGLPVRAQLREIRMTEAALPSFLRDVAELLKIGHDLRRAVLEAAENNYNPVFSSILRRMTAQMRLGRKLADVEVVVRSWLARMVFFDLNAIMESGRVVPQNVEDLYTFISNYNQLRSEAVSSMGLYRMMGYAVPVAIPVMVKLLGGLVGGFGSVLSSGSAVGGGLFGAGGVASIAYVQAVVSVLTVVAAVCVGLTITKATDFTVRNTLNVTILLVLAVIAISVTQFLPAPSLGLPGSPP